MNVGLLRILDKIKETPFNTILKERFLSLLEEHAIESERHEMLLQLSEIYAQISPHESMRIANLVYTQNRQSVGALYRIEVALTQLGQHEKSLTIKKERMRLEDFEKKFSDDDPSPKLPNDRTQIILPENPQGERTQIVTPPAEMERTQIASSADIEKTQIATFAPPAEMERTQIASPADIEKTQIATFAPPAEMERTQIAPLPVQKLGADEKTQLYIPPSLSIDFSSQPSFDGVDIKEASKILADDFLYGRFDEPLPLKVLHVLESLRAKTPSLPLHMYPHPAAKIAFLISTQKLEEQSLEWFLFYIDCLMRSRSHILAYIRIEQSLSKFQSALNDAWLEVFRLRLDFVSQKLRIPLISWDQNETPGSFLGKVEKSQGRFACY